MMGKQLVVSCLVSNLEEQRELTIKLDFSRLSIFVKHKESMSARVTNTHSQMVSLATLSTLKVVSNQRYSLKLRKLQTWSWQCQITCSLIQNWRVVNCHHKKHSTCSQPLGLLFTSCTNGTKILKISTNTCQMMLSNKENWSTLRWVLIAKMSN